MTLEQAQKLLGDPEAIKRNYLTHEVIDLAQEIATETKTKSWYGKQGYLGAVGDPYDFWIREVESFAKIERLHNIRQQSNCETLAQYFLDHQPQSPLSLAVAKASNAMP